MFKVLPTKGFQHHNWFVSGPISIDVAVYSLQPRVGDLWAFLGCLRSTVQGHDRPPRMSGTFCPRRDLGWRWDAELWWLQGQKKVHQVVFFRKVARNPCHPPQEVRTLRKLQGKINLQHSSTIEPVRSQVFTLLHFCSLIESPQTLFRLILQLFLLGSFRFPLRSHLPMLWNLQSFGDITWRTLYCGLSSPLQPRCMAHVQWSQCVGNDFRSRHYTWSLPFVFPKGVTFVINAKMVTLMWYTYY